MRAFVGRSAKITAPITMSCGAIADLASTIAKFSSYLCVASICIALISGGMWFLRYRRQFMKAAADGVMQPEEVMQMLAQLDVEEIPYHPDGFQARVKQVNRQAREQA